jgi:succinate dehydrogenase/fumarate reductase flavoprotein subunit
VAKGRRVFLDFRRNGKGFEFSALPAEARAYLEQSGARQATPLARLKHMNPGAVALYREHGIDLAKEPLEIAVCAQHNNGGLAANRWWESANLKHLFPVGEVNGSHGVGRPGGSALNAGQVGGVRAAEYIGAAYAGESVRDEDFDGALRSVLQEARAFAEKCTGSSWSGRECRAEFQRRMSRAGAHLRSEAALTVALAEAHAQNVRLADEACSAPCVPELIRAFENRQLCFAHEVYLAAQAFAVRAGVGSRGSARVLDGDGKPIPENPAFREQVQETRVGTDGRIRHRWVPRRPLPQDDLWFETAWADFKRGAIYL